MRLDVLRLRMLLVGFPPSFPQAGSSLQFLPSRMHVNYFAATYPECQKRKEGCGVELRLEYFMCFLLEICSQEILVNDGVLRREENDLLSFDKTRFDEVWASWALVWYKPGDANAQVRRTCRLMCWRNHCPHQHVCEEFWGLRKGPPALFGT